MHKKVLKAVIVIAALTLNSSCLLFHGYTVGRPIDETVVDSLVTNEAHQQDVIEQLGLPDEIIPVSGGTIYHYRYTKANTFWLLIIAHTSTVEDKVFMVFNDRRILVDKPAQFLTKDLGWRLWPFGR